MLDQNVTNLIYLIAAVLFILDLKWMAHPRTAVRGNLVGAVGLDPEQPWQPVPVPPDVASIWEFLPPYQVPEGQCHEGRGFWIKALDEVVIWLGE